MNWKEYDIRPTGPLTKDEFLLLVAKINLLVKEGHLNSDSLVLNRAMNFLQDTTCNSRVISCFDDKNLITKSFRHVSSNKATRGTRKGK